MYLWTTSLTLLKRVLFISMLMIIRPLSFQQNMMNLLSHFRGKVKLLSTGSGSSVCKPIPTSSKAIAVGTKTVNKARVFKLDNTDITCEQNVKLLGTYIDHKLNVDVHVNNLCRKAAQQVNILKRIGSHLNKFIRLTIFHSFILSNFNFCTISWHFCSENNTKKMEKIQERALRFVYNDYQTS